MLGLNMKHGLKGCVGGLLLLLLVSGCSTVPITGRKALNVFHPREEIQLGLQNFESMKKDIPISDNKEARALVERVGNRIAEVSNLEGAQWEFVVFESNQANAFALPGGKIGVYTGILPITQNEAGLATVLGHEVAHATARHGGERMTKAMGLQSLGSLLNVVVAEHSPKHQQMAATAYGIGAQLGVALPHDRLQESEADEMGLIYMARAGYDPEAAVGFWERFAEYGKQQGDTTPWFLRTHPVTEDRIANLKKNMARAKAEFVPYRR